MYKGLLTRNSHYSDFVELTLNYDKGTEAKIYLNPFARNIVEGMIRKNEFSHWWI